MTRFATLLLGFFWLTASAAAGSQALRAHNAHVPPSAMSSALTALDPYLVAPNDLGNIDLSTFLDTNPNLANYTAAALAADSSSAAIVLLKTSSLSDVTFSIAGGTATLLPYAANFMSHAPQAGAQSLVVTSANFVQANGYYYAPALLQGPLGGYSNNATITIDAVQDNGQNQASLALVMPPLVLAHGLWGNKSSMENVREYIDSVAPWKSQTQLVVPICYSLYLAFDATTDPLSGKDPCEFTSASALQTEIDSLMAELDSEHVVGGRVDLAAHSMGGLAARNYASLSSYASLRNRMLGQFHTIVTLDSPEIGSWLANWLDGHATNKRRAPLWTPPGFIWEQVCGSADVQVCFNANGYPLAAPSLPLNTGGVYSLEPNGPDLNDPNLVGPNIANATWRAVSATAPGNSALAAGLNTLISALYSNPYGGNVPTLNSILRKLPNDAIVTVDSQTNKATDPYTFAKLSHTSLVSSILTWLSGDNLNDDSVTDDPSGAVYQLTACWLETSGANSCTQKPAPEAIAETAPAQIALKPVDRIAASAPGKALLGKPFRIAIQVKAPYAPQSVSVYQRGEMGRTRPETITLTRAENGTVYATVTPRLLGPVTFGVRAAFSDGGVSVRQTQAFVLPPPTPPLVFRANELPTLVLTLNTRGREAMAHPYADYPAPVGRIWLDSTFVSWRLLPQRGAPAVSLDRDGLMHALSPGEAVAEARFGSEVDRVHILVRAAQQ